MSTVEYKVTGMTCGHCAAAVKDEVGEIAAVESVEVDLESGLLAVESAVGVSEEQIRAAVEEAGYELA